MWRTLTRDEWTYLLLQRNTQSGIRYVKAQVNGINGIIILPDNWDSSIYLLYNTDSNSKNYKDNIILLKTWTNVFESNGAVFLPAAGNFIISSVILENSCGHYHTSSSYYYLGDANYYHYAIYFSSDYFSITSKNSNAEGASVRLVCDVE